MKCMITFLALVNIIILGCSKDTEHPTSPGGENNLIANSSFEINGASSSQGWQFWSNAQSSPTFSTDVPPNGGQWSIVLSVGDRIGASLQTKVATRVGWNRYRLSLWAKSKGDTGFVQLIFNKAIRRTIGIQDSLWRYYEVMDSMGTVQGDSLVVLLDAGTTSSFAQSHFDLCRLEVVK